MQQMPWEIARARKQSNPYQITQPEDPAKVQERQLGVDLKQGDLARQPYQIEGDQLGNEGKRYDNTFKPVYDRINPIEKVRDGYRSDKRILAYEEAVKAYASGLSSPGDTAGDANLINAYAKILDPNTGVQQREGDQLAASSTNLQQLKTQIMKEFGADQYGTFSPEARAKVREAMRNRMAMIGDQARLARKDHTNYIKSLNIPDVDPDSILGPWAGEPFKQVEADYLKRLEQERPGAGGKAARQLGVGQTPAMDVTQYGGAPSTATQLDPKQTEALNRFMSRYPKGSLTPEAFDQVFFGLTGKNAGNAKEWVDFYNKHGKFSTALAPEPSIQDETSRRINEQNGFGRFMEGAGDTLTFGGLDEIRAGTQALRDSIQGEGSLGDLYNRNIQVERGVQRGLDQPGIDAYNIGQVGGGLVLPSFGARSVGQVAGLGAAYGGAYGFGSGEGLGGRLGGAALGGVAGGALGAGLASAAPLAGRGITALGRRIAGPSSPRQQAILRAGAEENVPLNMGDLYPETHNTISTLETIPGASGPVRNSIEAGRDAIEGRVQTLARGGTANENMGQTIRDAGERFIARSGQQADRLYGMARQQSQGVAVQPQEVTRVINGLVQQEAAVPGGTRAGAVIRQYAETFQNGQPITIDGARAMRSELAARLRDDGGLTRSQAARITGQIMSGVNQDIERSLAQAGRQGAVQAYRNADRFYAERMAEIENVTQRFLGTEQNPKSAEHAMNLMRQMAKPSGDVARMRTMLARLTPDERRDFAATLVEPLGRASADEPFSPATFIRNVRTISPAARRVIFGADGERSIQNLVRLSNAKKATVQSLNNSRSGQVSNYRTVLSTVLLGIPGGGAVLGMAGGLNGATGAVGGAAIAGAGVGVSRMIARALMNEQFTRAIASAPATTNPRAINNHMGVLRRIGTRDPNVRAVVESLARNFANDNVGAVQSSAAGQNPHDEQQ